MAIVLSFASSVSDSLIQPEEEELDPLSSVRDARSDVDEAVEPDSVLRVLYITEIDVDVVEGPMTRRCAVDIFLAIRTAVDNIELVDEDMVAAGTGATTTGMGEIGIVSRTEWGPSSTMATTAAAGVTGA